MNNAGDSGQFVESQGWLEPFRVFFDRSFPEAFSTALELVDDHEGQAAQLCVHAYAKAYSRWSVLGRVGNGESFVQRQLKRRARRADTTAPVLESGVGFKPWVYVSAIETGSTLKRTVRAAAGAGAAVAFLVFAAPGLSPGPSNDVSSIRSESETTPTTTSIAPPAETSTTIAPPVATTRPAPAGPALDREAIEAATEESNQNGFTLDLSGLPTSPDQISSPSVSDSDGLSE